MTDERLRPVDGCDFAQPLLVDLALDELASDERLKVTGHVERCESCRADYDQITETVAEVAGLAPEVELPAGFVERVSSTWAVPRPQQEEEESLATADGRPPQSADHDRRAEADRLIDGAIPSTHRRRRLLIGVVAAAVLLVAGFAGVAIERATSRTDERIVALDRVGMTHVRSGVLVTDYGDAGTVVVTGGPNPTLVMTLDRVEPGVDYGCAVRTADGTLVPVGSWQPATVNGRTWAVALNPGVSDASAVVLTGQHGEQIAVAQLA